MEFGVLGEAMRTPALVGGVLTVCANPMCEFNCRRKIDEPLHGTNQNEVPGKTLEDRWTIHMLCNQSPRDYRLVVRSPQIRRIVGNLRMRSRSKECLVIHIKKPETSTHYEYVDSCTIPFDERTDSRANTPGG